MDEVADRAVTRRSGQTSRVMELDSAGIVECCAAGLGGRVLEFTGLGGREANPVLAD